MPTTSVRRALAALREAAKIRKELMAEAIALIPEDSKYVIIRRDRLTALEDLSTACALAAKTSGRTRDYKDWIEAARRIGQDEHYDGARTLLTREGISLVLDAMRRLEKIAEKDRRLLKLRVTEV